MNKPNLICTIFYRLNDQSRQQAYSVTTDMSTSDYGTLKQDINVLFDITREHLDKTLRNSNRIIDRFRVMTTERVVLADEDYPVC